MTIDTIAPIIISTANITVTNHVMCSPVNASTLGIITKNDRRKYSIIPAIGIRHKKNAIDNSIDNISIPNTPLRPPYTKYANAHQRIVKVPIGNSLDGKSISAIFIKYKFYI